MYSLGTIFIELNNNDGGMELKFLNHSKLVLCLLNKKLWSKLIN